MQVNSVTISSILSVYEDRRNWKKPTIKMKDEKDKKKDASQEEHGKVKNKKKGSVEVK